MTTGSQLRSLQINGEVVAERLPLSTQGLSMSFAQGRVIVSDRQKVIWIDIQSGENGLICNKKGLVFRNKTAEGEPILRMAGEVLSYFKIKLDTWQVVPLDLGEEIPEALGFRRNGESIRYFHAKKRVERVSSGGDVVESIKLSRTSGLDGMTVVQRGLVFNTDAAIFFWPFGQDELQPLIVAGSAHQRGRTDGVGRHARFNDMGHSTHIFGDGPFILVWDYFRGYFLRRIDVETDEVRTCNIQGLNLDVRWNHRPIVWPVGNDFYLLDNDEKNIRLLHCSVEKEQAGIGRLNNWCSVDFAEDLQPLTFRLRDGSVLHFDARILKARSEYFERMLASGCREALQCEVDLTGDAGVTRASLEIVLRFIATGALLKPLGVEMSPEQLFEVRSLADRYQLVGLKEVVECEICQNMSTSNVLSYLSKVVGTGEKLECACWELFESKRDEVLDTSEDILTSLIQSCPELGTALLMRGRKRRKLSLV
mmetsp:Transcript_88201/g.224546  ORF Transcript_88201/g.224546 Transcript_88201/m.224546 type:complete len:481 (-) Transcript_88201:228-1670(-)